MNCALIFPYGLSRKRVDTTIYEKKNETERYMERLTDNFRNGSPENTLFTLFKNKFRYMQYCACRIFSFKWNECSILYIKHVGEEIND